MPIMFHQNAIPARRPPIAETQAATAAGRLKKQKVRPKNTTTTWGRFQHEFK